MAHPMGKIKGRIGRGRKSERKKTKKSGQTQVLDGRSRDVGLCSHPAHEQQYLSALSATTPAAAVALATAGRGS